jgi:ADP-ribose pyrophosphatase YjhB (NUDIX family)
MEPNIVNAVGVWFYAQSTQKYLYLMRNDRRNVGFWGLPGGKVNNNESLLAALKRECQEELGLVPDYLQLVPVEKFTNSTSLFCYHTFWCAIPNEFTPTLNHEHLGYAWIQSGHWPRPMHPGLWNTLNEDVILDKIQLVEQQLLNL